VDVAFAVHPDFKSHTGALMTLSAGALQGMSWKHKMKTRSSTEGELVGADAVSVPIMWTLQFMKAQGKNID